MLQDHILLKQRHQKFIKKVCETEVVYLLECEDGFATSSSNEFEDEEGEPSEMMCFWSEPALARACIRAEWNDYKIKEITLSEFMEYWCTGLNYDNLLAGTNFDRNMFGYEIDPIDILLELIKELKLKNKELKFSNFYDLSEFEREIIKANK